MSENVPPTTPTEFHLLPAELLHDLRTPLNHVLGYAELLEEQATEGGHQELLPFIRKIHTAAHQLVALLEENFHSIRSLEPDRRGSPRTRADPPTSQK